MLKRSKKNTNILKNGIFGFLSIERVFLFIVTSELNYETLKYRAAFMIDEGARRRSTTTLLSTFVGHRGF